MKINFVEQMKSTGFSKIDKIADHPNVNLYIANQLGVGFRFVCGDKFMGSFHTVGEVYSNYYDILTYSYTYIKDNWNNMDDVYILDICKNQTNKLTSKEIGTIQAACDYLQDGTEQQQIIAYYLQKVINKLKTNNS